MLDEMWKVKGCDEPEKSEMGLGCSGFGDDRRRDRVGLVAYATRACAWGERPVGGRTAHGADGV